MVQRRAARYVTNRQRNTSSVGDILQHLEWCSLEDRRRDACLVMMYKSPMTRWWSVKVTDRAQQRRASSFPSHRCRLEPPTSDCSAE